MAFPTAEELTALITPVVATHHLDVEGLRVTKAGPKSTVAIKLDSDSRPDLDLGERPALPGDLRSQPRI